MPLLELSTALTLAGSSVVVPFVNKVLEKTASRVGDNFDASLAALFTKAHDYLAVTGREPQPVEPKLLLPLVQAASLETDETLAEKWAALLANAADPVQRVAVQPGFVGILREFAPIDAQVLEAVAGMELPPNGVMAEYVSAHPVLKRFAPLGLREFNIILGNLTRLGVCLSVTRKAVSDTSPLAPRTRYNAIGPGFDYLQITPFGNAFLNAVTPPMA